jgi:CHAD domain-containing protein
MHKFPHTHSTKTFQERVTSLTAALSIRRSSQKENEVHRLRSGTRRVEAQLILLELSQILPPDLNQARRVRKRLKTVRRAAGSVRDMDVQVKLIDQAESELQNVPHGDQMRLAARQISEHLQQQREHEASRLERVVRREGTKLATALQELESTVRQIQEPAVPTKQLVTRIESWFYENSTRSHRFLSVPLRQNDLARDLLAVEDKNIERFHKIRKVAKLCRYMLESLPRRSLAARHLTSQFEAIQEAGGHWHDWLLLEQTASEGRGKQTELAKVYAARRDIAFENYCQRLAEMQGQTEGQMKIHLETPELPPEVAGSTRMFTSLAERKISAAARTNHTPKSTRTAQSGATPM